MMYQRKMDGVIKIQEFGLAWYYYVILVDTLLLCMVDFDTFRHKIKLFVTIIK